MPHKRRTRVTQWKRELKAPRRGFSDEVKQRILGSVVQGSPHWTLDPNDLGLPSANKGSRRIVFEATYGPVSRSSIVYSICSEPECVRPDHCRAENVEVHKLRSEGKLPRLIFAVGNQVQTVEAFEETLRASPSQMKDAVMQRKAVHMEKKAAQDRKDAIARSISSVEDP